MSREGGNCHPDDAVQEWVLSEADERAQQAIAAMICLGHAPWFKAESAGYFAVVSCRACDDAMVLVTYRQPNIPGPCRGKSDVHQLLDNG